MQMGHFAHLRRIELDLNCSHKNGRFRSFSYILFCSESSVIDCV